MVKEEKADKEQEKVAAKRKEWEDELTDKQRVILEQPSVPGSPAGAAARQRMAEASAKL